MTEQNGSSDRREAAPDAPVGQKSAQTPDQDGTGLFPPAPSAAAGTEAGGQADPAADTKDASGQAKGKTGPPKLNELVDEPAKVMRIGTMIKQLLDEVRNAPLDDAARNRLAEIHERSLKELEDGLAPELVSELHRINLPFGDDSTPTDAELRIAQAQLVGWLEGLFRGIQTAIAAQQSATHAAGRLQLRQLPPGTMLAPGLVIGDDGEPHRAQGPQGAGSPRQEPQTSPGQYL
ncbi:bacterial proteasome activator family protein [Arthrobacter yangruifuii]|uniref:bacterial proteasome activator family protein n=1 Tax=Arthrobacter yangruifuii TaxID=2606616 RepID=UPI0011B396F0|nr:bacterial proteasome activator family protein [Arthrobacter yangruifuii]